MIDFEKEVEDLISARVRLAIDLRESKDREEVFKSRIEELEIIIETATIICWKEDELPDAKNMIMGTAAHLIKQNLDKARPFQQTPEATYWHKLKEAKWRQEKLVEALRAIINTGDKVSMIKTAKNILEQLGIK